MKKRRIKRKKLHEGKELRVKQNMFKNSIILLRKKIPSLLFFTCLSMSLLNSCVTHENYQHVASTASFIGNKPSIDVCFSPEGNCQPIILSLINNANAEILVQSYSFTSQNIANALIRAHQRGIKVKILFDRSQLTARHSQIHKMIKAGIEAFVDPVPGIAHNKVMIIDNDIVLAGSYNWTNAAETRNAENLLIIKDLPTVKFYKRNWKNRYQRAKGLNLQDGMTKKLITHKRAIKPKLNP